ncbi:uncharacterized protein LOC117106242 isoform X3 [Anneissia japonica]|uniref:uncharacterized protein LOC117106242 isoform X3 n=1 Tax=Anneissia japonica TaxID=1529436 RepID=UPI0014259C6B|nr:uncharacterized protein LOC117106242 isoform X3 [Anneissia japonica]
MESMLTHKEAIQAWHEGVTAFDCGNNEKALEILLQIPQNSTTARILYNIGHIYLILNQYAEAAKNFEAAFEKDVHLAAAFYQCGVALYQDNKFNNARKMFEKSKECLRESQYIDYKALGMTCRLYKCEILLNLSIAVAAMTKDPEWALDILTEADKCQREKNHIQVIQSAKIKLQDGLIPTIFSLPQKEIFRPPKDKIENLSKKDYLGQATVVHAVPGSSIKTFEAAVEKDEHMAIGFFQHGIALARQSEYQLAWDAFDKARRALRKNDSIDYKQIGLPYKLYECEVLNNQSLMYMYLGDQELAKKVLELALKKKAEVRHSKIDAAMDKLKASSVFDLFTLPKDAVFKPPASKVENIKKVDYLGQKKVVAKFEERELTSRPIKLTPRLSMDLSGIPLSSTNPNGEAYRRSSSPGINITHHGSLGNENVDVFTNVTDDNEFEDNRCYSPPAIDENKDSDTDTYGPIPESLRAPSPGPPTRPAPTPPIQQIWERKDSLGPPIRDAPSPPHPLKPENEETELYTNFPAKNNNTVYNSSHLSPTNKKPLPLPKPTRF